MTKVLTSHQIRIAALILSILFFLMRGIQYALLERYIPLGIIVTFLILYLASLRINQKYVRWISKAWGLFIITWSIARLIISLISLLTNTFDEFHLINQFGLYGICQSMVMLLIGIILWRHKK